MMSKWKQISSLVRSKALVPSSLPSSYTFTPNKEEVIESRFRLRYSTTCNSYYRDWSDAIDPSSQGVISGWDKVLYSVDSVHRQINEEAGQVYLERVPGANTGCIKWRINFGCCGLLVDEVTIRLSCVEDYGGEVVATLMGTPGQKRVRYPIGSDYVTYTELENSSELTLTIHFVGEPGQVTRLFPQSILRGMGYPLDIRATLKPPLQSLGRPRILVGLLYSSSQENEVDGRHYKQNTTNTGQGFLHIHLLKGMDLPQGKHGLPEPFSKCYLLPDAKKSTKCRTKARKGKDPLWNEQFLIVGVNFHDVKRRALEICIADSHTSVGKKAKLLGGVRLSLGYKAVVAQQTKQVSQVLRFLKGKGGVPGGGRKIDKEETVESRERKVSFSDKDTVIANVNSSFSRWKKTSGKRLTADNTDKKEKEEKDAGNADAEANNNTEEQQITVNEPATKDENTNDVTKTGVTESEQQSASSTSTEDMAVAWDPLPDPTTKSEPESGLSPDAPSAEKVDREKERSAEERLFQSVLTSIKQLEIAARSSFTLEPSEEKELQLCIEGDKQDELRRTGSGFMITKGSNEALMKEKFEKQESQEILTQFFDGEVKQEKNALKEIETLQEGNLSDDIKKANEINEEEKGNLPQLAEQSHDEDDLEKNGSKKIEIQGNGDLINERFVLNDTKEATVISKTEVENENLADSGEQNGDEFSTKVKEAVMKQKSAKEDSSLSSVVTKAPGAEKTFEGKYNSNSEPRNEETEVVESQRNDEHTKTQRALKKTSSGSNEIKHNPSFTLKDFAKKISSGRRSRSDSEETGSETGLETNANKVMLDAEGLEITQWTLVVDRPKQWHYCWHILRPEMTILH